MTLYHFVPSFLSSRSPKKLSSVKTGAKRVPDKLSGACRPEISVLMPTEFWNPTPPSFALFAQINQNCSCSLHGKSITNRGLLGHRATLGMIQLIYVGHESWRRSIAGLGRNPKAAVYIYILYFNGICLSKGPQWINLSKGSALNITLVHSKNCYAHQTLFRSGATRCNKMQQPKKWYDHQASPSLRWPSDPRSCT